MDTGGDFFMFLPSNSSKDCFPNNTLANYKVYLPRPVHLCRDYEVGLVEAHFTRNWHNVLNGEGYIEIENLCTGSQAHLVISDGLYNDPDMLLEELNNVITEYKEKDGRTLSTLNPISQQLATKNVLPILAEHISDMKSYVVAHKTKIETLSMTVGQTELRIKSYDETIQKIKQEISDQESTQVLLEVKELDGESPDKKPYNELLFRIAQNKARLQTLTEERSKEDELLKQQKMAGVNAQATLDAAQTQLEQLIDDNAQMLGDLEKRQLTNEGFYFSYGEHNKKMTLSLPPGYRLTFSKTLMTITGFEEHSINWDQLTKKILGKKAINLNAELNSLFVYCDIVENNIVGDSLVPLLRIVNINDSDGLKVTKTYQNPFYVPVARKDMTTVEIDIKDAFGRAIHFSSGDLVTIILHFRPTQ
jgi:hypothetical protein